MKLFKRRAKEESEAKLEEEPVSGSDVKNAEAAEETPTAATETPVAEEPAQAESVNSDETGPADKPAEAETVEAPSAETADAGEVDQPIDTVLLRSDEEAHRNEVYRIPSRIRQTLVIAGVELKRIAKTSRFITMFALGVVMVVLLNLGYVSGILQMYVGMFFNTSPGWGGAASFLPYALCLLPFFGAFYCAATVSQTIPNEFKERTVFLHYALPVSKGSLYLGKYLASFFTIVVFLAVGFGAAMLSFRLKFPDGDVSMNYLLNAFIICVCAAFALSSMIYSKTVKKSKGSTFRGFLLIIGIIPLLIVVPMLLASFLPALEGMLGTFGTIAAYLPMSGFDYALYSLGGDGFALSAKGIFTVMGTSGLGLTFDYPIQNVQLVYAIPVYIIWGVLFLILGIRKLNRREL